MLTRREALQTAGIIAAGSNAVPIDPLSRAEAKDQVVSPHFDVTWVGGPTMAIMFDGLMILTDPTLGDAFAMGDPNDPVNHQAIRLHRRLTPVAGIDLKAVDLILLSHVHEDHFDQQAWTDLDHELPVVLPIGDVEAVGGKGFRRLDGLGWGETRRLDTGSGYVTITAMVAHHSRNPAMAKALGIGNGYWIEFSERAWRRTMYWTGDTMPTDDVVAAVRSRGTPDLMVPHAGGVGVGGPLGQISMRASDVVDLAAAIQPKHVLPIHHSTYAFYREPIGELVKQSKGKPYRLDLVTAGSKVVYS